MPNEGSRGPSISFPLGLALLIILLICISGFFSCCYNWNKIRSLLQPSSTPDAIEENHSDSTLPHSPIIKVQKHFLCLNQLTLFSFWLSSEKKKPKKSFTLLRQALYLSQSSFLFVEIFPHACFFLESDC